MSDPKAAPSELPLPFRVGLESLARLDQADFERVTLAVSTVQSSLPVLARTIGKSLPTVEDPMALANTLLSLCQASTDERFSLEVIAEGAEIAHVEQFRLLLRADALVALARAARVSLANENNYATSSTVSNVRYLFDEDASPLAGAVVVTNIRIGYWDAEEQRTFEVACDADDLRDLQSSIDRALLKIEHLEEMLGRADEVTVRPFTSTDDEAAL